MAVEITVCDVLVDSPVQRIQLALANNPSCPPQILHRFLGYEIDVVTLAVAKNPATQLDTIVSLFESSVELVLAQPEPGPERIHPVTGKTLSASLSHAEQVLHAVGRNASLPMSYLTRLWESDELELQVVAGFNPSLPLEVVEQFSRAESFRLRRAVAGHRGISIDSLKRLASDEDEGVLRAVAGNPRTPASVLHRLAKEESRLVQQALRSNPNLTVSLREKLHIAVEGVPRAASPINPKLLASLPKTPEEFEAFLQLPEFNETFWLYLASGPDTPFTHVIGRIDDVQSLPLYPSGVSPQLFAAHHVGTPQDQLELLANYEDKQVRRAAAQKLAAVSTNSDVLERLVRDGSTKVRKAVASHAGPAFPETLWNELANDQKPDVRSAVLDNPNAPDVIRAVARMNELAEAYVD